MASWQDFALVSRGACVVGVSEHSRQCLAIDRSCLLLGSSTCGEAPIGELVTEFLDRVAASGEKLERMGDQGSAVLVDRDGANLSPFAAVDDVEVPNGCTSERAALLCLLAHLV